MNIWSSNGKDIIFFYPSETLEDGLTRQNEEFRGLTGGGKLNLLYVGSNSGKIHVFEVSRNGGKFSFHSTVSTWSDFPITCIISNDKYLLVSNELGEIFGFDIMDLCNNPFKFLGKNFPCNSLLVREETLIAAFSTGHIRVFNLLEKELSIELTAHSRSICCLTAHPVDEVFASCGEDEQVHIWSWPKNLVGLGYTIELLSSFKQDNTIFVGMSFQKDDILGIACYDQCELKILRKANNVKI